MSKKAYKVTFINQTNGEIVMTYVLTDDIRKIEVEFADIISIEPKTLEEL